MVVIAARLSPGIVEIVAGLSFLLRLTHAFRCASQIHSGIRYLQSPTDSILSLSRFLVKINIARTLNLLYAAYGDLEVFWWTLENR